MRQLPKKANGWQPHLFLWPVYGALLLLGCIAGCQSKAEIEREKYITEGIRLYRTYCANCHQTNGEGLAALYPPLAKSDYLTNKNAVICLMRRGQQGPIKVNGRQYNRVMPAQLQLSDLEIAELTTYIYNKWGDEATISDVRSVRTVLAGCQPTSVSAVN